MQLEIQKYLYYIQESIISINEYLGDKRDFEHYQNNKLLSRAVLEIIGEATGRILKLDPTISIANSRRIVDLRNWVIHGYDKVDNVIIWGVLSRDIPKLKVQVEKFLPQ